MEIFAHALWATAAGKAANRNGARRVRVAWFAAWAMFPDLFSFAPPVVTALWYRLSGAVHTHARHAHHEAVRHGLTDFDLYDLSHSLVVFVPVFAIAWLIWRRPVWELLGWALHILMDIPTHSAHYPTPFLWPVSTYRFVGISWRQWWFMSLNYAVLALVFLLLWMARRRDAQGADAPASLSLRRRGGDRP
jgi:hypothetical protein